MSTTNHIITLEQAKQYLKISDTSYDELLTEWIGIISDGIERYCGCKFKEQTITGEITDGLGTSFLFPKFVPVIGLANGATSDVQYRESYNGEWKDLIESLSVVFIESPAPFIELLKGIFPRGRKNISINYKCGFEEIPGDIQQVALEMLQMMWNESKQGGDWLGKQSKVQPEGGTSRAVVFRDLLPRWMMVMNRYRNFRV